MSVVVSSTPSFITGVVNPEDMVRIPGTPWVFVSGYPGPSHPQGQIYLVHTSDHRVLELWPDRVELDPDPIFGDVAPPDPQNLGSHGVGLRPGPDGTHTLYLVNHGGRESVEVLRIDTTPNIPHVTWIGAVELGEEALLNDVAPHPDGGFVVSDTCTGGLDNAQDMIAGKPSGRVLRWSPGDKEMTAVENSFISSPNGVEVSRDGRSCLIASWVVKGIVKIDLEDPTIPAETVELPVMPDNFTWNSDGTLFITGQNSDAGPLLECFMAKDICPIGFSVIAVDPDSLERSEVIRFDSDQGFGTASSALEVGDDIWVGSPRADRIAVFRNPRRKRP